MISDERMTFMVKDNEGKDVECEVLFTFEAEDTGKNYMVYTDHAVDEEGNTKVYASIYTPGSETTKLEPLETEEEWEKVEMVLEEIQKSAMEQPTEEDGTDTNDEQ